MLTTIAEQSGFARTGRYDEVERLCAAFQQAYPAKVRCFEFGRTPENRPMLVLAASEDGVLDPAAVRERQRPVALMQGGIHAGEIDGKDAGFLALKQLLDGAAAPGALSRVTLLFVPVFNVDGHERFGRWNRPNQVGPEEMGWRATAQNLNLNRDYVKADAPEMRAMLALLNEWDPILMADLHVTNGAQFEHDVSITSTMAMTGDAGLQPQAAALQQDLIAKLATQGSLPLDFYPDLSVADEPAGGFYVAVALPRFSDAYWASRNRIGVLVETHSWKDYPTRVRITRNTIVDLLELTAERGSGWLATARAADERAAAIGGTSLPLAFRNTERTRTIAFRGYAYTREPSAASGALVPRYDPATPQVWNIPLRDEVVPSISAAAPRGGYVVPAAHASWVSERLAAHGIESRALDGAARELDVEVFRATQTSISTQTFEGRVTRTVDGTWAGERRNVPAGSLFVPIAQAKSRLVVTLFEPTAPDSFVGWGFFNAAFEAKEYMETYVADGVARDMLADPAVKEEFERRLRDDPAFAGSPQARLEFFYRRHSSWDERLNLYPVYRLQQVP